MLLAMLIVTPIALLSWKFIEQPALRLKSASLPVLPILKATRAD
jgi:peptidoglycan/LPS O-acetylase OafA/YrhL